MSGGLLFLDGGYVFGKVALHEGMKFITHALVLFSRDSSNVRPCQVS